MTDFDASRIASFQAAIETPENMQERGRGLGCPIESKRVRFDPERWGTSGTFPVAMFDWMSQPTNGTGLVVDLIEESMSWFRAVS